METKLYWVNTYQHMEIMNISRVLLNTFLKSTFQQWLLVWAKLRNCLWHEVLAGGLWTTISNHLSLCFISLRVIMTRLNQGTIFSMRYSESFRIVICKNIFLSANEIWNIYCYSREHPMYLPEIRIVFELGTKVQW